MIINQLINRVKSILPVLSFEINFLQKSYFILQKIDFPQYLAQIISCVAMASKTSKGKQFIKT